MCGSESYTVGSLFSHSAFQTPRGSTTDQGQHFVLFPCSALHRPCLPVTLTIGITIHILTQTAVLTTMVRLSYWWAIHFVCLKKHRIGQRSAARVATFEHFYSSIHTIVDFLLCRITNLLTFSRDCMHTVRRVYIFFSFDNGKSYYVTFSQQYRKVYQLQTWCTHFVSFRRRTVNNKLNRDCLFCTKCCSSLQCKTVWKEKQHRCQRTSSIHGKQWRQNLMQREFISILYNLIHCFINADESMTDIQ